MSYHTACGAQQLGFQLLEKHDGKARLQYITFVSEDPLDDPQPLSGAHHINHILLG
jgi:hypothetical protein